LIDVPSDEAQLIFYHWYDIENYFDGGNVKISLDEGASWELITPEGGYPEMLPLQVMLEFLEKHAGVETQAAG